MNSDKLKYLVYLNAEVGSVFRSQVAELLFHFHEKKIFHKIFLLCGNRNEKEKQKVIKFFENSEIELIFFRNFPNYFFFNFLQAQEIKRVLKNLRISGEETVIHIRGELLGYHALPGIKSCMGDLRRTLVDIRGASWDETLEFQKGGKIKNKIKEINYKKTFHVLSQFGAVSSVSQSLKEYVEKKSSSNLPRSYIVPCLVSESIFFDEVARKQIRDKLGITDEKKLMIFSSGGTAAWQQIDELKSLVSARWTILNLSPNPIEMPGIINDFVNYEKVPSYLSAADAALIFRSASIVNHVACPVKFCEYLCSGLPVISNNHVKMISDYIKLTGHGLILNHPGELHQKTDQEIFKNDRSAIRQNALKVYGIAQVASAYKEIYIGMP